MIIDQFGKPIKCYKPDQDKKLWDIFFTKLPVFDPSWNTEIRKLWCEAFVGLYLWGQKFSV
jgi:hypothetical protein